MLLRSSSTPSLSSLLPSVNVNSPKHSTLSSPRKYPTKRLSIQQKAPTNPLARSSSCTIKTEIPSSTSNRRPVSRLQRAQSEGNLNDLVCKPHCPILPASDEEGGEEGKEKDEIRKVEDDCVSLETAYRNSKDIGSLVKMKNKSVPSEMDLAMARGTARGIEGDKGVGHGHGGGYDRDGSGRSGVRDYYKRMVEENPGNPLFLSNYAQFLHQSNDLRGAEENYARAILMDPSDSRILSTYAQVIWELHHDEERATSYFERALQVAPQDGQVLAAYASFLWDTQQAENSSLISKDREMQIQR